MVDPPLLPAVSVPAPNNTFPAPAREPIISLAPLRLSVAPAATDTADTSPMPFPPANSSVPALMLVRPVYRLLPDRVTVPEPVFVRSPAPATVPLTASVPLEEVRVLGVVSVTPPLQVR